MAQATFANTTPMSAFTRRMFLSRTAVVSTAAVVAAVPALAENADAELLAIGREFEPTYAQWLASHARYRDMHDRWDDATRQSFGVGSDYSFNDPEALRAFLSEKERIGPVLGYTNDNEHDNLLDQMGVIEGRVLHLPAASLTGLAIKARGIANVVFGYWDEPEEELDWGKRLLRDLLENICALARAAHRTPPKRRGADMGASRALVRSFPPVRNERSNRRLLADAIEKLIDLLDAIDAKTDDREDGGDAEPSLAAIEYHPSIYGDGRCHIGHQLGWAQGSLDDREDEHDGTEPEACEEPSLGSFDRMTDQTKS